MNPLLAFAVFNWVTSFAITEIRITAQQAQKIGSKIWYNESKNNRNYLVHWHKAEPFLSLGIGHFIWYPINSNLHFEQTFPDLIKFLQKNKVQLPDWLLENKTCPWSIRDQFIKEQSGNKVLELRKLLEQTFDLQTQFIIQRVLNMFKSYEKLISKEKIALLNRQVQLLLESTNGIYALIDYVNFKGTGLNPKERYNNQGWGLLQVLEEMKHVSDNKEAVHEFMRGAKKVLELRVKNAPETKKEALFLRGWFNRIDTYTTL